MGEVLGAVLGLPRISLDFGLLDFHHSQLRLHQETGVLGGPREVVRITRKSYELPGIPLLLGPPRTMVS